MADTFGSAYAVGGFGQGFAQGMGIVQKQQELNIKKEQEAREQDIYERGKNKAALLGNIHALNNASMDYDNHQPVDAKGLLDQNEELSKQAGAPSIRKLLDPKFQEWHNYAQQVHQDPSVANSKGFIDSANWRFNDELNEPNGEKLDRPLDGIDALTGKPVKVPQGATRIHTEFDSFHPGQGGSFIPELNVHFTYTDKDGIHHAIIKDPMTEGRSVLESDNKIKQIDMNDFSDNTMAEAYLHKAINSPEVRSKLESMVLANGGTYDDLYPVRKGQDIKQIMDTSDGSDDYKGLPAGTPAVRSVVIGKDGKEHTVGAIDARQYPGSNIYRGAYAADVGAQAKRDVAGINAAAKVKAAQTGGKGGKDANEIEQLAQSYMQQEPGLQHGDAYVRAEAVHDNHYNKLLSEARKEVTDRKSPNFRRSAGDVAQEWQQKAVQARTQLGKPQGQAPTVSIEDRTKQLVDQEKRANNGTLSPDGRARIKAQLAKEYPNH